MRSEVVSYLVSLVQFSPATGRAGHCRELSLCVDSTHRVPATLGLPHTGVSVLSLSTLLRLPAALYGEGPALSAVPVFGYSQKRDSVAPAFCAFPGLAARGLGALSPDAARLFPPQLQRAPQVGCLQLAFVEELASSCNPPGGGCRPSRISGIL